MSKKRDYTRYSKESVEVNEPVEVIEVTDPIETITEVGQESMIGESEPIIGVVTDCLKLNVREQPDAKSDILSVITASTELVIIDKESTNDFYKICTSAGLEGYCMKKYITIMP